MSALPDLPGGGHVISHWEHDDARVQLRFVSDFHPEGVGSAYVLTAFRPVQVPAFLAFVERMRAEEEIVYPYWLDGELVLGTDSGDEFGVTAEGFEVAESELSAAELRVAMQRVYAWYRAENEQTRRIQSKLQRLKELLQDQATRISAKAAGHAPDSSAGVLYGQQLAFIERLLRDAEG